MDPQDVEERFHVRSKILSGSVEELNFSPVPDLTTLKTPNRARKTFFICSFLQMGEKLWKNPVDFFPALYPVKNNCVIIFNPAADPVVANPDTKIILIPGHFVNIKFVKDVSRSRDLVKDQPFNPGPVAFRYRCKIL
jgi:hypothetical protein